LGEEKQQMGVWGVPDYFLRVRSFSYLYKKYARTSKWDKEIYSDWIPAFTGMTEYWIASRLTSDRDKQNLLRENSKRGLGKAGKNKEDT
jgi:hypothetical protein